MDIDDAIMLTIIGGHYRFEKILSASYKKCKMSRASFDKHLKQLVDDKYVIKKHNGKIIEYHVNPSNKNEFLDFKDDEQLNEIILENEKALDPNIGMLYSPNPKYYELVLQTLHNHINMCLNSQRKRMILLNMIGVSKSLQNKHKKELEKSNIVIKQSLQILHKFSPEISKEYERYLLKKINEDKIYNIQEEETLRAEKLVDIFFKHNKK